MGRFITTWPIGSPSSVVSLRHKNDTYKQFVARTQAGPQQEDSKYDMIIINKPLEN